MNAIVTYVYPFAVKYLSEFINYINDVEFEGNLCLIIFNDDAILTKEMFNKLNIPYQIIDNKGTINECRFNSFKLLKEMDLENIFFQDIDDLFNRSRFKILHEHLHKYEIVCNDICAFYDKIHYKDECNFWKNRLGNEMEFNSEFVIDKNVLGLGNTGIRSSVLRIETNFSNEIKAYDWFYFYQIMKVGNIKALFTSSALTYYRQHELNIAGAGTSLSDGKIKNILNIKEIHYKELLSLGYDELEPYLNNLYKKNNENMNIQKNYFWWEL